MQAVLSSDFALVALPLISTLALMIGALCATGEFLSRQRRLTYASAPAIIILRERPYSPHADFGPDR